MTSGLHFELFMQEMRIRALEAGPRQLQLTGTHFENAEEIGSVRLSHLEAAMKETRADRVNE
jgi:hypothetical protein